MDNIDIQASNVGLAIHDSDGELGVRATSTEEHEIYTPSPFRTAQALIAQSNDDLNSSINEGFENLHQEHNLDNSSAEGSDSSVDESGSGGWEDFAQHEPQVVSQGTASRPTSNRSSTDISSAFSRSNRVNSHSFLSTSTKKIKHIAKPGSQAEKPSLIPTVPSKDLQVIPIPRGSYARARRVIVPSNSSAPLMTVNLRSELQFIHRPTPTNPH